MSTKLLRRRGPDLLAIHEVLSVSAIVAIVIHGIALLGDGYLKASLVDIAVPFAFSYKTLWTSIGIIAGWSMAILGLSYYVRHWIGAARWRKLHRLTARRVAGRSAALPRRGHGRRPALVPDHDGGRRSAGRGPAAGPRRLGGAHRAVPSGSGATRDPRGPHSTRPDIRTVPHGAVPTAGVSVRG